MLELVIFINTLFGNGYRVVDKIDYCELDDSHLSLEMKIELSMGCSTVNGKNVYRDSKLKRIYGSN